MRSLRLLAALTTLSLSLLPLTLVQSATNCGIQSPPSSQQLNASLEYLIRDPFSTPTGLFSTGSGDWKWNIGTVSHNLTHHGKNSLVSQSFWLETESFIDLTSPSLGYTGCGAIMHGLTHAATVNGQNDAGDCRLTLSLACSDAIQAATLQAASRSSRLTNPDNNTNVSAATVCSNLAFPIPTACNPFFEHDAYIQTFVFASPDSDSICSNTPAASNFTNPLASWSPECPTYSPESMVQYNNLTTQISPLITTVFTNLTSSINSPPFISQYLSCLRPANISQNSTTPSNIPNDNALNLDNMTLSPTVSSAMASPTRHAASHTAAAITGGAEGMKLMMDWMCMFWTSTLLRRVLLV